MKKNSRWVYLLLMLILVPLVVANPLTDFLDGTNEILTNYESHKSAVNFIAYLIIFIAVFTIGARAASEKMNWSDKSTNAVTVLAIAFGLSAAVGSHIFSLRKGFYALDLIGPYAMLLLIAVGVLLLTFFFQGRGASTPYMTSFLISAGIVILYYILEKMFDGFPDNLGNVSPFINAIFTLAIAYLVISAILYFLGLSFKPTRDKFDSFRQSFPSTPSTSSNPSAPTNPSTSSNPSAPTNPSTSSNPSAPINPSTPPASSHNVETQNNVRESVNNLNNAETQANTQNDNGETEARQVNQAAQNVSSGNTQAASENLRQVSNETLNDSRQLNSLESEVRDTHSRFNNLGMPKETRAEAEEFFSAAMSAIHDRQSELKIVRRKLMNQIRQPDPNALKEIAGLLTAGGEGRGKAIETSLRPLKQIAARVNTDHEKKMELLKKIAESKKTTSKWVMQEINFLEEVERRSKDFVTRKIKYRPRSIRREYKTAKKLIKIYKKIDSSKAQKMEVFNNTLLKLVSHGGEIDQYIKDGIKLQEELEDLEKKKFTLDQKRAAELLIKKDILQIIQKLKKSIRLAINNAKGFLSIIP